MFDDAKYMAKEAVDRNNALADLDQQRSEDTVRAWSRNAVARRGVSVCRCGHRRDSIVTGLIPRECSWRSFWCGSPFWLSPDGNAGNRPFRTSRLHRASRAGCPQRPGSNYAQTDRLGAGVTATAGVIVAVGAAALPLGDHALLALGRALLLTVLQTPNHGRQLAWHDHTLLASPFAISGAFEISVRESGRRGSGSCSAL